MSYAVIDIGTNTLILLIAKPKGKKEITVLHDEAVITRLGQGLTENHFFHSDAMTRSRKVLADFKKTCDKFKVKKILAVGTAGCRLAANADVFINSVKKECGIKIQVISGDEEAEYAFAAAWHDFGDKNKKLIVVDIGGGSTEIITGPISKKKSPETVISLHLGSVRLTEQFVRTDPISREEFQRLHVGVKNNLADELDGFYPETFNPANYSLVASAGTATTLAAIDKKMKSYKPDKIHGASLKKENLESLIQQLASLSVKERQKLPGLEPLRADVILAGALLLNEILAYFQQKQTVISDHGIRYGIFYKKFLKI
jgi:exopolyphosphatase/guanosine-5'-triphosphate,3'-diphosphate pyrophosphatase